MGDRSSIIITSERFVNPITLYGHWSGDHNRKAVENVIARTDRIGDPSYLTAQIFYEFAINLGDYDGNLSFGIGTWESDDYTLDDNQPVYVNADTGEVTYECLHPTLLHADSAAHTVFCTECAYESECTCSDRGE